MSLERFLNLCAACVGALGSIYVLKSFLVLSPALTADLATPRWGFSTTVIDSLSDQRAESIVGAGAVAIALLIAVVSMLLGSQDLALFPSTGRGLSIAAIAVGGVAVIMQLVTRHLSSSHRRKSRVALLEHRFDNLIKEGKFKKAYVEDLAASARVLVGLELGSDAGPRTVFEAVAKALGRSLPLPLALPESCDP